VEGPLRPATETFRAAVALGHRTLQPASGILVSAALVNFVWTGLAVEFFRGGTFSPAGDSILQLTSMFLTVVALAVLSVGFLLLLPLQDSLERGRMTSERAAARVVLRRTDALAISGLVQGAIVFGPPTVLFVSLALQEMSAVTAEGGTLDPATLVAIQSAVLRGSLGATCLWLAVTNLLFLFAAPFLLLEGRGPLRSIRLSVGLVLRRGLPEWGRFFAIALLWGLLYAVVVLPGSGIQRMVASLPRTSFLRTTLPAAWSAASSVGALAYGAAGLVVLFRRLLPAKP